MRKKLNSVLCLVLSLCMILSTFAIFASAEEGENPEEPKEELNVIYNRDYEEGWGLGNGMQLSGKGNIDLRLDYRYEYNMTYNYFALIEDLGGAGDGFISIPMKGDENPGTGKLFMEFDFSASDGASFPNGCYYTTTGDGDKRGWQNEFFCPIDGYLYMFGKKTVPIGYDWLHIAIKFDFDCDDPNDKTTYKATYIVTEKNKTEVLASETVILTAGEGGRGIGEFRLGAKGGRAPENEGAWMAIDNLKLYNGVSDFTELPEDNYGTKVNPALKPDVEIKGAEDTGEVSLEVIIKNSFIMKKGVDYAYIDRKQVPIRGTLEAPFGAPVELDGEIMISLERFIEYIGYPSFVHDDKQSIDISTGTSATYLTVGRKSATVDGKRVDLNRAPVVIGEGDKQFLAIALSDISNLFPGYYTTYDSMGLITISKYEEGITQKNATLSVLMDIMKDFIFDYKTPDEVFELTKKNTNNFSHPYIFANQAKFDELRAVYNSKEGDENYNPELKAMLEREVDRISGVINPESSGNRVDRNEDGKYVGILPDKVPVNRNKEQGRSDGYDVGGRLHVQTGGVDAMAFAYQMTGDLDYVRLAYDWIVALGKWEHWGQGHFLNCADGSAPVATAIDWMWPGMIEAGLDPTVVLDVLHTHGVHMGYLSSTGKSDPFPRNAGNAFWYTTRTNNWNAVCSSGMIIASLCTMGSAKAEQVDEAKYIVANNFKTLVINGMGQYAPDGSYVESASYWAYGTNALFKLETAMMTAIGDDFGLLDCWGLDNTCYFACHVEDSSNHAWSYHDGNSGSMDTSWFAPIGQYLGDMGIVSIRKNQLKNGKGSAVWDILFYVADEDLVDKELPLQYHMVGIDGFSMRSSWEKGSMFAGVMGGDNGCPHGQIDAGAFVYHKNGKVWIEDLGGDDYNIYDYWSRNAYNYYRKSSQGNNTICMTTDKDLPFGQDDNATGLIDKTYVNDHGTYAILDNTAVFAGNASYWRRGMMATNDRNTVVIQDEISLAKIQTLYWFAHYNLNTVKKITLSADKRTAYLTGKEDEHGETETIRLSLVSKTKDFKFEIMDTESNFVLSGTYDLNYSVSHGGQPEKSRKNFNKLAIKAENTLSFNVAVVIEQIDPKLESEVGYEWTEMLAWEPYADTRGEGGSENQNFNRPAANKRQIVGGFKGIEEFEERIGNKFGDKLDLYYQSLTALQYNCIAFRNEPELDENTARCIKETRDYVKEYDEFIGNINNDRVIGSNALNRLMGI